MTLRGCPFWRGPKGSGVLLGGGGGIWESLRGRPLLREDLGLFGGRSLVSMFGQHAVLGSSSKGRRIWVEFDVSHQGRI